MTPSNLWPNHTFADEVNINVSRADLVVMGDGLHGIEIKGDGDTFARLQSQVPCYEAAFPRVWMATTTKHATKAAEVLPGHWGIIIAGDTLETTRLASENPNWQPLSCLHLLWVAELKQFYRDRGLKPPNVQSEATRLRIVRDFTAAEILAHVIRSMQARTGWRTAEGKSVLREQERERLRRDAEIKADRAARFAAQCARVLA